MTDKTGNKKITDTDNLDLGAVGGGAQSQEEKACQAAAESSAEADYAKMDEIVRSDPDKKYENPLDAFGEKPTEKDDFGNQSTVKKVMERDSKSTGGRAIQ